MSTKMTLPGPQNQIGSYQQWRSSFWCYLMDVQTYCAVKTSDTENVWGYQRYNKSHVGNTVGKPAW